MTDKTTHATDVELTMTQKLISGIALAVILWSGATTYTMSITVAVTKSQVDQLVLNAGDHYTATQAATDKQGTNDRLNAHDDRFQRLERLHGL